MATLPQQYVDMISAGASLRDFHVALIGELDKAERQQSAKPVPIANELETRLGASGMTLFEADDGAIDFKTESDIDMVKAALCTNFSKEKFVFAEKMIRSKTSPKDGLGVPPKTRSEKSPIEALTDLRTKAEAGEIPPSELKMNLKVAILRELDADQRRELPIAEKVAEDAEKKLAKAGARLYEDDDSSIEFCQVGRPNVTEDTLHLVKGALASNFSREKLHYASELQTEFRRRGYDRYQIKRQSQERSSPSASANEQAPRLDPRNQRQQSGSSNSATYSYSTPKAHTVGSTAKWILAAAAAAVVVVVSLIIKALKK